MYLCTLRNYFILNKCIDFSESSCIFAIFFTPWEIFYKILKNAHYVTNFGYVFSHKPRFDWKPVFSNMSKKKLEKIGLILKKP